mmetsp:Transcript_88947/g.140541  ORF Transcript_88947/g.140541 Transcript_88947/m.140541 type:complete len:84 (-) Transcript_88947:26-277(-)
MIKNKPRRRRRESGETIKRKVESMREVKNPSGKPNIERKAIRIRIRRAPDPALLNLRVEIAKGIGRKTRKEDAADPGSGEGDE